MILLDQHFTRTGLERELTAILCDVFPAGSITYVLCVGTDRHILDCLGPLTGSMVKDQMPQIPLYGTLSEPLHAHNLTSQLSYIRSLHAGGTELAIDASLGGADEVGRIRMRKGSLSPGKAVGKTLPDLGDYALTGIVKNKGSALPARARSRADSLAVVYDLARIISSSIVKWYDSGL
jgi:putative sporulation protein YyaC